MNRRRRADRLAARLDRDGIDPATEQIALGAAQARLILKLRAANGEPVAVPELDDITREVIRARARRRGVVSADDVARLRAGLADRIWAALHPPGCPPTCQIDHRYRRPEAR